MMTTFVYPIRATVKSLAESTKAQNCQGRSTTHKHTYHEWLHLEGVEYLFHSTGRQTCARTSAGMHAHARTHRETNRRRESGEGRRRASVSHTSSSTTCSLGCSPPPPFLIASSPSSSNNSASRASSSTSSLAPPPEAAPPCRCTAFCAFGGGGGGASWADRTMTGIVPSR
jgi:hypothetical protein